MRSHRKLKQIRRNRLMRQTWSNRSAIFAFSKAFSSTVTYDQGSFDLLVIFFIYSLSLLSSSLAWSMVSPAKGGISVSFEFWSVMRAQGSSLFMRQLQNQINLSEHQFYMNIPLTSNTAQTHKHNRLPPQDEGEGEGEGEGETILSKGQMKELIDSYVKLNDKLMDRIAQLEEELREKDEIQDEGAFHQEYSIVHANADEIEELVLSYRKGLNVYQGRVEAQLKQKNEAISKLEQEIAKMGKKISEQSQIIEELQSKYMGLEQINHNLMLEVEQMEGELMRRAKGKRNSEGCFGPRDFNEGVQLELEKLINKLMEELEHERSSKKKLGGEVKRLQGDILDLQREIITKNNQIYSLQLKSIKNNKSYANLTLANLRPNHSPTLVHNFSFDGEEEEKTKRKQGKSNNMSLKQLNEDGSLGFEQKINLCIKLIDSYIGKLERKDLTLEDQASISVEINEKRSSVQLPSNKQAKNIGSPQMVIDNLVQVLEGVVGRKKNKLAWFNPREKSIGLLFSSLKGRKGSRMEDLCALREQLWELLGESAGDGLQ